MSVSDYVEAESLRLLICLLNISTLHPVFLRSTQMQQVVERFAKGPSRAVVFSKVASLIYLSA